MKSVDHLGILPDAFPLLISFSLEWGSMLDLLFAKEVIRGVSPFTVIMLCVSVKCTYH